MSQNKDLIERCVLACRNTSGEPDFAFVKVRCNEEMQALGCHYDTAILWATENGYEGPFIVWDAVECPEWLSERFIWDSASIA